MLFRGGVGDTIRSLYCLTSMITKKSISGLSNLLGLFSQDDIAEFLTCKMTTAISSATNKSKNLNMQMLEELQVQMEQQLEAIRIKLFNPGQINAAGSR